MFSRRFEIFDRDVSVALLPRCLSNSRAMGQFQTQMLRLRDFTGSYDETSYRCLSDIETGPKPCNSGSWTVNASRRFCSVSFMNVVSGVFACDMRRNVDLLCAPFTMTRQNLTRESSSVNKGTSFLGDRKVAGFESLSMPFNQHCGAIYLRSKSYLVFKISSDIMTKHCCQACVLSMMLCRSDSRLCAW